MTFPAAEELLEQHRPPTCQSRLSAYFTAATAEHALVVKHGMHGNNGTQIDPAIHVHEVEVSAGTRCPMILVQAVETLLRKAAPQKLIECVASAYWASAGLHWHIGLNCRAVLDGEIVCLDQTAETPIAEAPLDDSKLRPGSFREAD